MPPTEYRIIDKHKLLLKYTNEGWEEKLLKYRRVEHRVGFKKVMVQFLDGEGDNETEIALLRVYENPNGTETVVHRLREGDVLYSVP